MVPILFETYPFKGASGTRHVRAENQKHPEEPKCRCARHLSSIDCMAALKLSIQYLHCTNVARAFMQEFRLQYAV